MRNRGDDAIVIAGELEDHGQPPLGPATSGVPNPACTRVRPLELWAPHGFEHQVEVVDHRRMSIEHMPPGYGVEHDDATVRRACPVDLDGARHGSRTLREQSDGGGSGPSGALGIIAACSICQITT